MSWSTREIADLAGTTLRTVRYYHEIGLLEPPVRAVNGYKQYGVSHLLRLLRIRRLLDLGMSIQQIHELGDLSGVPEDRLRSLNEEVVVKIQHLERVQQELGRLLEHPSAVDLPVPFADAADQPLSEADVKLLVVLSRVLDPAQLAAVAEQVRTISPSDHDVEFDKLPPDATVEQREDLALRMLPASLEMRRKISGLPELTGQTPRTTADEVIQRALTEIYNPAQILVLERISELRRHPPSA